MDCCQADSQHRLASQQTLNDFGGKSREGGQATKKAGNRKQLPGQWEMRVDVEQANCDPDQIAADDIGRQGAERQGNKQRIQRQPEQPARPGTQGGTGANGEKIEGGEIVQGRHGVNCSVSVASAG
ncbi:MAG: hypothetical protein RLZZ298_2064 [Pseudomonadota bacterium]